MIARQTRAAALRRNGYTLLEMTLALVIALIILGAVYEFLNRQITMAEIGRDKVEETKSVRQIMDRLAGDIVACLGGVDPKQVPEFQTSPDDGVTVVPVPSPTPTTSTMTTTTTSTGTDSTVIPYTPAFNTCVEGSSSQLILSVSRVPRELLAPDKRYETPAEAVCDLRRISYWFVQDGSNGGLAREELTGITTGDFSVKPPDVGNVEKLIISGHTGSFRDPCEVAGVTFEYFDGASWQSEWNGADFAADGVTPIGPPSAIRITLTMKSQNGTPRDYKRTVAIPAGNNFLTQQNGF